MLFMTTGRIPPDNIQHYYVIETESVLRLPALFDAAHGTLSVLVRTNLTHEDEIARLQIQLIISSSQYEKLVKEKGDLENRVTTLEELIPQPIVQWKQRRNCKKFRKPRLPD